MSGTVTEREPESGGSQLGDAVLDAMRGALRILGGMVQMAAGMTKVLAVAVLKAASSDFSSSSSEVSTAFSAALGVSVAEGRPVYAIFVPSGDHAGPMPDPPPPPPTTASSVDLPHLRPVDVRDEERLGMSWTSTR
jgi:hypothetical protein